MTLYSNITETIGQTPLLELRGLARDLGLKAQIFAKLEFFNPGGSVKDRAALAMIKDAEIRGLLHPGGLIVEPTSGNTGIGLALVARSRGYRAILTMPESMSLERRRLLKAYGEPLPKPRKLRNPIPEPSFPISLTTPPTRKLITKQQALKFGTTWRGGWTLS